MAAIICVTAAPPEPPGGLLRDVSASVSDAPNVAVVLTAGDIADPHAHEARAIHERSQDLLQRVINHRGIQTTSRVPHLRPVAEKAANAEADVEIIVEAHEDEDEANDERHRERHMLASRLLQHLRRRGIHGIRQFRVMLHTMDLGRQGTLMGRSFEGALTLMGIRLKKGEYNQLLDLFGKGEDEDDEMVDYVRLLACGCSNWSERREEVVQEAYDFLRVQCPGSILTRNVIETRFRPEVLTGALVPELLGHHSSQEFLNQWHNGELGADGVVRWMDFLDYYVDVSMCIDRDEDFCKYVCKSWGIDMDDWLAKKVFTGYVTCDVDNVLTLEDFMRMVDELDPTTSHEEALAWFRAIDEDDSGEVSLEEFLNSKVLKVKRLFDHYDDDHSRTISGDEMKQVLKSLNDQITESEAQSLYQYADMDGNGEISFCEFLENNLLKMLQIFDEFDTDRSRAFNEAEMKMLIRRLDKQLDDHDVHQIYKAIDVDGSGSISFIEFVESHVLRAKTIFDRYDMDRSRTLTQFKFRELMLDMDGELTNKELEAIYELVCDQNTGKVHLGGFMNPNIVKMKLLFDKYDQDRGRTLDSEEFKLMLRDLFKNAAEKDINELSNILCPPENPEVTFTVYIQRFREIQRRHDLIILSRRRKAREKARKLGLKFREPDD